MNIGTVVEGPTDRLVLQAILDRLFPGDNRYIPFQPPVTLGETGAGWKGVRCWCRQTWQLQGSTLEKILSSDTGPVLDMLVIQVDAEIAAEHDLQEGDDAPIADVRQPCPPVAATAGQLRRIIERWLRCDDLPPRVILAIPAQDTENWTFAALFPNDALCMRDDYECTKLGRGRPGYQLTLKKYGNLFRRRDGKIKKSIHGYLQAIPQIVANWDTVCRICSQAQQFTQDAQEAAI